MTKCDQYCKGTFIKGSGLEDSLVEINVFGIKKVIESVCFEQLLYARCSKGFQILLCYRTDHPNGKHFGKFTKTSK